MSSRVLILGANGQLGRELARADWPTTASITALGRDQVDLTIPGQVEQAINHLRPSLVINAAAYTAVDRAESEADLAQMINAEAPGRIAAATGALDIPLIHISTDYVFNGTKPAPYVETDIVAPLGVYGASKADGEARVRAANFRHVILRTSWLYSPFGNNFVRTMLRLGVERDELRVVSDQIGTPTAAGDLAQAIRRIAPGLQIETAPYGTYHLAGNGEASWHDFADAIFSDMQIRAGRRPRLIPIPSYSYQSPARRPANSRLDTGKFCANFGFLLPSWRHSLAVVLETLHRDGA